MNWWPKVERREVPRPTSLGARGTLPREVGTLIPPQGVLRHCTLAPPAAPSPRAVREGNGKPRTHCAARRRECGCLKRRSESKSEAPLNLAPLFCGERSTRILRCAAGEGRGTALPDQEPIGSKGLQRTSPTRESSHGVLVIAWPLTRSLRRATASTSPRKS